MVALRWHLDRDRLDELAARSHERATAAWEAGRLTEEVVEVDGLQRDEGVRPTVDRHKMASLKPLLPDGVTTAAMSSQLSDGAAALLIASDHAAHHHGLQPVARFHTMTVAGDDPVIMLTAPIVSTRRALEHSSLGPADIGLAEINEAFASVVLACEQELGLDDATVHVNGGAIAIGHPLGAMGARS
jgi:acetyl-CoA C-acetyltransferase